MIALVCLDNAALHYELRAINPNTNLIDLFDEKTPCSVKIVPSLPPYAGIGGTEPTENEILFMTLSAMNYQTPMVYVNHEGRKPFGMKNPANYMLDHKCEFSERIITPEARGLFELPYMEKYVLPKEGFGIKLSALLKIEPKAVPLVITVDKKNACFVHAYYVGNRFYFLYNVMGISHRPDSKIFKDYGFLAGDLLFNLLLEKYSISSATNKSTYYL